MKHIVMGCLIFVIAICVTSSVAAQTTGAPVNSTQQGAAATPPTPPTPKSINDELQLDIGSLLVTLTATTDPQKRRNAVELGALTQIIGLAIQSQALSKADFTASIEKARADFTKAVEESRSDVQVGTSASGGDGSTSVVSKGSVPAILGFAVENGALTQTTNGTTVTFRGSPVGIIGLLTKENYYSAYNAYTKDRSTEILSRLTFAVSFDTSRGTTDTTTSTFTGTQQQLSSYSFHADIINHRDPRSEYYQQQFTALVDYQAITDSLSNVIQPLMRQKPKYLLDWVSAFQDSVANASVGDLPGIVANNVEGLAALPFPDVTKIASAKFATLYAAYLNDRSQFLDMVAYGAILSAEYIDQFSAPALKLPSVSSIRIVGETGLFKGQADLSGNLSFDLWNTVTPSTGNNRLKDIDFSAQIDIPLTNPTKIGNFLLTGAYKYRDYTSAGYAPDGTTLVPKGVMNLGQVKLTIPVKGSGVKIPISVSFANRSEYIKESEVRGNVGVTFNIDTILAGLGKK